MFQDQCISITELRVNTKKNIDDVVNHEKYVFINNKPKAVILDINVYEKMKKQNTSNLEFIELSSEEVSSEVVDLMKETKKMSSSEFINI